MSTLKQPNTELINSVSLLQKYVHRDILFKEMRQENIKLLERASDDLAVKLHNLIMSHISEKDVWDTWQSKCLILESDEPEKYTFMETAINAIITVATGEKKEEKIEVVKHAHILNKNALLSRVVKEFGEELGITIQLNNFDTHHEFGVFKK